MNREKEIIVEIGAEGGSITLFGVRDGVKWRYHMSVADWTPELIDQERLQHDSDGAFSWEGALRLLDRYPWQALSRVRVHPEFRKKIWTAVQKRCGKYLRARAVLERWRECCRGETG
jgi:hypothetical protein